MNFMEKLRTIFVAAILLSSHSVLMGGDPESNCHDNFSPVKSEIGYQVRTNGSERCEGVYITPVSSDFEILSFIQGSIPFAKNGDLHIQAATAHYRSIPGVNITALSLAHRIYYRMDGRLEPRKPFVWPTADVVRKVEGLSGKIGVLGWLKDKDQFTYVPLKIESKQSVENKSESDKKLLLTVRAGVGVEAVLLQKQGSQNTSDQIYKEEKYQARDPIEVEIPSWKAQGKNSILIVDLYLKPRGDDQWLTRTLHLAVDP